MNRHKRNPCSSFCTRCFHRIRANFLLFLITLGIVIGFAIGILVHGHVGRIKDQEEKATLLMLLGFPGELLMNMLKLLVTPLLIASLICALASVDSKATNRIARRTLVYYLTTTILAVILGIVLVVSIRPGIGHTDKSGRLRGSPQDYRTLDAYLDLIRSCFPSNLISAMFSQKRTKYTQGDPVTTTINKTIDISKLNTTELSKLIIFSNGTHNLTTETTTTRGSRTIPSGLMVDPEGGANILGICIVSIVFGIVLGKTGDRGIPLKAIFESLNEVVIRMIGLVMWYSPIGICSLICVKIAGMDNIVSSLMSLGMYMMTVVIGLTAHAYIILPLVYLIITRKNPCRFVMGMRDALLTAFGTSSSTATLPVSISCLEDHNKIDSRISRFVLPLGATINMDGTALYEAVAAVFIAQANGIELGILELIITCFTAAAASIGAAGMPQAGLVTMVTVLQAVNLPLVDIGLILSVDWFLDRVRTSINVLGDAFGAGIVEHLSRDDLMNMDFIAREEIEPLAMADDKFNPRDSGKQTGSDSSLRETNF